MTTHDEQHRLLEAISRMGSAGRAEGEDPTRLTRTFWPVPEHLRAFDPDVVLVVGPRGAGKTELFRAVIEQRLLPTVSARVPGLRLPPADRTQWLGGYPIGTEFPSEQLLREFVREKSATDELLLEVWLAYLVRALKDELREPPLESVFAPRGGDVGRVLDEFRTNAKAALLALDSFDHRLVEKDRHVIVAYDELDTLARNDADLTRLAVRGLVALWAGHSRRWRRLRGKIFLRTDLYERAATAGGADFAKLAANRAELAWTDRHLYAMLVRRLANSGEDDSLRKYCEAKIGLEEVEALGWFPRIRSAEDVRPLIERMIGVYMGANERKGLTWRWLLDHIRDGRRQALPRPMVLLFEAAAGAQKASGSVPRWPRLLEPRALRRALDRVSEEHVGSALDEWPWIEGLKGRLRTLREVPWERREIDRHLDRDLGEAWGKAQAHPPAATGHDLVEYLVEVGIFRARTDDRIDAPDLFLAGLGLKRKGGVRQR
jgi:hypothetical protein